MFENIKNRYDKGWVRIDQLRRYVELGVITVEEFKLICGEDYI
jgi:uncharacterized XkdX family phage protein